MSSLILHVCLKPILKENNLIQIIQENIKLLNEVR